MVVSGTCTLCSFCTHHCCNLANTGALVCMHTLFASATEQCIYAHTKCWSK